MVGSFWKGGQCLWYNCPRAQRLVSRTLVPCAPSGPVVPGAGFCSPSGSENKIKCHACREGSFSPTPFPPAAHLFLLCPVQPCRHLEAQPLQQTDETKLGRFREAVLSMVAFLSLSVVELMNDQAASLLATK